jgi:hypothetical protein
MAAINLSNTPSNQNTAVADTTHGGLGSPAGNHPANPQFAVGHSRERSALTMSCTLRSKNDTCGWHLNVSFVAT